MKHFLFSFFLFHFAFSSSLFSQTNGLTLVAHLDKKHGSSSDSPPIAYNGCWGYTAPNGKEYAILGTYTGTSIIDISDSAREVAFVPGPTSLWREMRVYKNYAYVVSEGGWGTQIIDLSNLPNSAAMVDSFVYTSGTKNSRRAHTIGIFNGYMYLNGCAKWSPGGVLIFSLADPIRPQFLGEYAGRYLHDSYVRNDTLFGAAIYGGGGIDIVDVKNKTAPTLISRITYSGSGTHNVWTTSDGKYVISTDEIGSTSKTLKVWDLSTLPIAPTTPSATFTYSPADIEHNITMRGKYAYVAWYTAGTAVVDFSNPLNPQTAGYYDSYAGASGSYNGVWSIYPYFPSGKIISGDMQTGLYVFRFNNLAPRVASQNIFPTDNAIVTFNQPITFRWKHSASLVNDPHYYNLHIFGNGVDTTVRANDSTISLSLSTLQLGLLYKWNVITKDEFNTTIEPDTFQFQYGVQTIPAAPTNLTFSSISYNSVALAWIDNATNEAVYRVYRSTTGISYSQIFGDFPANTQGFTDNTVLSATKYYYQIYAYNGYGLSNPASGSISTLASPPNAPILGAVSYQTIIVKTNYGTNSDNTQLAIQVEGGLFNNKAILFVQANGSVGNIPAWKNYFEWGGTNGIKVQDLYPQSIYAFKLKARNPDGGESALSSAAVDTTIPALNVDITPMFEPFGTSINPLTYFPPDGWKTVDVDHDGNGVQGQWHLSSTQFFTGTARYFCYDSQINGYGGTVHYDSLGNIDSKPANDYIFTLPLQLTAGTRYNLSWWYRTVPGYGHNIAALLSTFQKPNEVVATLSDKYYVTFGGYTQEVINFTPVISGVYYIAWRDHSPTDKVTIRIDDAKIEKAPANDLKMNFIVQINQLPTVEGKNEIKNRHKFQLDENDEIIFPTLSAQKGIPAGKISGTKFIRSTEKINITPITIGFENTNVGSLQNVTSNASVFNVGQNNVTSSDWNVNWTTSNISQPQKQGVNISTGNTGNVGLNFLPPHLGTYFTTAKINFSSDGDSTNNSANNWLFAYPQHTFVLNYDSVLNSLPPYRTSLGSDYSFTAAVRFTVPHGKILKLGGMRTYYNNIKANQVTPVLDSLNIAVWGVALNANGTPDYSTVGPKLFEKKVGGNDYLFNQSGFGNHFLIPLDDANMIFTQGQEFFLSITFSALSSSPMSASDATDNPGLDGTRSYSSTDEGQTWTQGFTVNNSTGAWYLRGIFEQVNSISATALIDNDGNLSTTNDRTKKQGWKISLFTANNVFIDSLRTDSLGEVMFSALNYNLPDGNYKLVEETRDGFLNLTPTSVNVSVASSDARADFINAKSGTISGNVFNDMNSNGTKDTTDVGIVNWKILLSGAKSDSTTTDANGSFIFGNLFAGNYSINEGTQNGWSQTFPQAGNYSVTLSAGGNVVGKNFGNFQLGSISGSVFNDFNGNGTKDTNDVGITIHKIKLSGAKTDSFLTTTNGNFAFYNLPAGNYTLSEVLPNGWIITSSPIQITITSGKNSTKNNVGNFQLGIISGVVFNDANGNGTKENGEQNVTSRKLYLFNTNDEIMDSTVSSEEGYSFTHLVFGMYNVRLKQQNGTTQTTENPTSISITSGTNSTQNNFGVFQSGSISGIVFNDANANGTKDGGEVGLLNWKIKLSGANNDSALSDASGNYSFGNISAGNYTVSEVKQSGYYQTLPNGGTYSIVMTSGGNFSGNDFGNYQDTMQFRTIISDSALAKKAVKLTFKKKKLVTQPNLATVTENLFKKIGKSGATFLGIPPTQKDSAKKYAWVHYKTAKELGAMLIAQHNGNAYPLDSFRAPNQNAVKLWGALPNTKAKELKGLKAVSRIYINNIAWEQGILLKTNIKLSQYGITPANFGSLVIDTSAVLAGRNVKGMTVRLLDLYFDSIMTYYRQYNIVGNQSLTQFQDFTVSVLKRINEGFVAAMDSTNYRVDTTDFKTNKNLYAIKLKGVATAGSVGIVKYIPGKIDESIFPQAEYNEEELPNGISLEQNYPNPFNPVTVIRYSLSVNSVVSLKVFDVLGREVAKLLNNEMLEEGEHEIEFDANTLPSGVYFYRLNVASEEGNFSTSRKLMLMK